VASVFFCLKRRRRSKRSVYVGVGFEGTCVRSVDRVIIEIHVFCFDTDGEEEKDGGSS
jgi:hypothetical protein